MNLAINIKTEVSRDRISQEFSSEINGVHERLYTQAVALADQGVRQALIELGWTPPAEIQVKHLPADDTEGGLP
jgi:hypothetical protein